MPLFASNENRIRCGKCGSEFDLNKNKEGCPLCGFGNNNGNHLDKSNLVMLSLNKENGDRNYLAIPPSLSSLPKGKIVLDEETKIMGLWGMFNDFFSGKAVLRICSNILDQTKEANTSLLQLVETTKLVIKLNNLSELKGFPNDIKVEAAVNRLVYHFIKGFYKMGLFEVNLTNSKSEKEDIFNENWSKIIIRPTQEGLAFARIKNTIFDENKRDNQVLSKEEQEWLIDYLKKLDKQGFKEFTWLHEVYSFIKKGNNGKDQLWAWFKKNPKFIAYVERWSSKKDDDKRFGKQLDNLAQTFSSGKISLLRELGIIKNKRNDYTVIGDLK